MDCGLPIFSQKSFTVGLEGFSSATAAASLAAAPDRISLRGSLGGGGGPPTLATTVPLSASLAEDTSDTDADTGAGRIRPAGRGGGGGGPPAETEPVDPSDDEAPVATEVLSGESSFFRSSRPRGSGGGGGGGRPLNALEPEAADAALVVVVASFWTAWGMAGAAAALGGNRVSRAAVAKVSARWG